MNLRSVFKGILNTKACQIFLQVCHIPLFHKEMLKMHSVMKLGALWVIFRVGREDMNWGAEVRNKFYEVPPSIARTFLELSIWKYKLSN